MSTLSSFSTRNLAAVFTLSSVVAALLAALSLAGLLFPALLYPTADLRNSSIPTDVVNLVIGLPILLVAMILARRGRLTGLLFWPGMLLFVTYHAIAFAVGVPFTGQFYLYAVLTVLSVYTLYRLLASVNAPAVRQRLEGKVHERITGGALIGLGLLFAGLVAQILTDPASTPSEVATGVADLTIIPALLVGGVLLWQRQTWGYVVGAGLLFLVSMLFVGLLVFFILQPFVADVPFSVDDFIAIAVMSVFCFIPLGLFFTRNRESSLVKLIL
jgi:membrane protein implicated in regulation of membrane protease activity